MSDSRRAKPLRIPLDIIAGDDAFRQPSRSDKPQEGSERTDASGKPFLMVWFKCAASYQKVFRNPDATCYVARCPKCAKTMEFAVGNGGQSRRMFEVSC